MINKDTYKRLTNKKGDHTTVSGSNCPKETKRGYFCDKENCKLRITRECPFLKSFDRLAELEDKIENGTLVEIPCKIGDVFYYVSPIKKVIEKHVVTGFEIGRELRIRTISDCYSNGNYVAYFYPLYFGKTLFAYKEQAEARLKELQEGKK